MSDLTNILDKVKKLLALSRSSNANESANATALANKLIDQYRLSTADLEATDVEPIEPIGEDPDFIYQSGRITQWKLTLLQDLCKHYGVAVFNSMSFATGRKVSRFKMVGRVSDMSITRYLYTWLVLECQRLSELEAKGSGRGRSDGRIFVASYCDGFVSGIREQLQLSRDEVKSTATASSIVKIDARLDEANVAIHNLFKNIKTVSSTSYFRRSEAGFNQGQLRGKQMHLGASMSAGGTRALGR